MYSQKDSILKKIKKKIETYSPILLSTRSRATKGSLKNTTIGRIDKDVCLKNIGRMKAVFGKSSRILGRSGVS